jgi:hypothetical protein
MAGKGKMDGGALLAAALSLFPFADLIDDEGREHPASFARRLLKARPKG